MWLALESPKLKPTLIGHAELVTCHLALQNWSSSDWVSVSCAHFHLNSLDTELFVVRDTRSHYSVALVVPNKVYSTCKMINNYLMKSPCFSLLFHAKSFTSHGMVNYSKESTATCLSRRKKQSKYVINSSERHMWHTERWLNVPSFKSFLILDFYILHIYTSLTNICFLLDN